MNAEYVCEQCGDSAALCVSGWGYVAALCDRCLSTRQTYFKIPEAGDTHRDGGRIAETS
jgi:hypothetical protein